MSSMKIKLLALSALSSVSISSANAAGVAYNAAVLHGNGASSIANVLVQELNCFGGPNNPLAVVVTGGTSNTTNVPEAQYNPASPTAGNPSYTCDTKSVQPNVNGEYVSTGSGGGRSDWFNFTDAATSDSTGQNPFEKAGEADWGHIHFAFSDAALSATDLTNYQNNAQAQHGTGAPIQVPLYVLPVAVAYNPVYGVKQTANGAQNLSFAVKTTFQRAGGGLRLSRAAYCGIVNGTITNWNDPALTKANGNQSLRDPNDDLSRWTSVGVPIVLVGRQESSGTTNIFTRALGAQCQGNYADGTNTLPAAVQGTARYDEATGQLIAGSETAGKFGLVPNSDGIANTISPSPAAPSTIGQVALNGKLGYVGADYVSPAVISNSPLFSADLQVGSSTKYAAPSAANATLAFKAILPPQSASTGKYDPSNTANGQRSDPNAWVEGSSRTVPLANPTTGYPFVGTSNALLYTCYANPNVRTALVGFLALHLGKYGGIDSTGAKFPAALVTSTGKAADGNAVGIDPRNNIAPLSAPFITALFETFLTNTTTGNNPGALNLWIQNKLPAKAADLPALQSNNTCQSGQGA